MAMKMKVNLPLDSTPVPVLVSAIVAEGSRNVVQFTFDVAIYSSDYSAGLSVKRDTADFPISMVTRGDGTTKVFAYMSRPVLTGEVLTASYNAAVGDYQTSGGYVLASFTDTACTNNAATHAWLETQLHDYPSVVGSTPDFAEMKAPKTFFAEGGQMYNQPEMTWFKWNIQAAQAVGTNDIANIQAAAILAGIEVKAFRMLTPHHTFGYNNSSNMGTWAGHGLAHADFGDYTHTPLIADSNPTGVKGDPGNSLWYQGHWVYLEGATIQSFTGLGATGGTVTLSTGGGAKFEKGDWIAIRPAIDSFINSDNRRVLNIVGDVLTLDIPYHCTGYVPVASSYIAPHACEGNSYESGDGNRNWLINMSSICPLDLGISNDPEDPLNPNRTGKKVNELQAQLLRDHLQHNHEGTWKDVTHVGLHFDVDRQYGTASTDGRLPDYDNDGAEDKGVSSTGVNWVGIGWNEFYQFLRDYYPSFPIVGGTRFAQDDWTIIQGTQEEAFLTGFNGKAPAYGGISRWMQTYLTRCHYTLAPTMEHSLMKQGTVINPRDLDNACGNLETHPNNIFRVSFCGILMNNGWFHQQNTDCYFDPWYDEYAVDVIEGSANYGSAIENIFNNESSQLLLRQHQNWLGDPLSSYYRIYAPADFDEADNILTNGDFDTGIGVWTANVTGAVSWLSGGGDGGSNALLYTIPTTYKLDIWAAKIFGETFSFTAGEYYVLCFMAKCETGQANREITLELDGVGGSILLTEDFLTYALTIKANTTGTAELIFQMGRFIGDVTFCKMKLFHGQCETYRRDYEHGIALMNGQNAPVTIPLEKNYMKIDGNADQDRAVNDGSTITSGSIDLGAYEGQVLVRIDPTTE